ncbi:MAG: NTP transferase domain-containing protein, partial [Pseudomonadota bacterium]
YTPRQALAVVSPRDEKRSRILEQSGWTIVTNPDAETGQASSIVCAMNALRTREEIDQIVILLGDMPHVPPAHLSSILAKAAAPTIQAVMSISEDTLSPPALFKHNLFPALASLSGDRGAKSVFLDNKTSAMTLPLSAYEALDIDSTADLSRAKETEHA